MAQWTSRTANCDGPRHYSAAQNWFSTAGEMVAVECSTDALWDQQADPIGSACTYTADSGWCPPHSFGIALGAVQKSKWARGHLPFPPLLPPPPGRQCSTGRGEICFTYMSCRRQVYRETSPRFIQTADGREDFWKRAGRLATAGSNNSKKIQHAI